MKYVLYTLAAAGVVGIGYVVASGLGFTFKK